MYSLLRRNTSLGWALFAIIELSILCSAANPVNFSGKYSELGHDKNAASLEPTLVVVQNADSIEITKVQQGKKTVNRYPLNGAEGDYITPSGIKGKCKAQFKGASLILESGSIGSVQLQVQNATQVRMHTKEQWQLSADSKFLTIKIEISFPDFADIADAVNRSDKEKYIRVGD